MLKCLTSHPRGIEEHIIVYHSFIDDDGNEFGSFETFYRTNNANKIDNWSEGEGWFWWACFPGCLPDGEPTGPFTSEDETIEDAQLL